MKAHIQKKMYVALGLVVLAIIALAVGFFAKLYPVALVDGQTVSFREWSADLAVAQKLDPAVSKSTVFEQFLVNKQKQALVRKLGLFDNDFVEAEQLFYKTGNETEYNKLLTDYFSGNESLFLSTVVEPQAFDAKLRIKYNSNFGTNNDAYNKATNVLDKIQAGQLFEDLAKQYSDDKVSGQLGGDIGFVTENQILPELKKVIQSAVFAQVHKNIIVSRQGYHVLYPVEVAQKDNQKVWHIKQILIQTTGYDSWLTNQLQTIGTHRLIKI